MVPTFVMPAWMQSVSFISPIRWAMLAIEGGVWRNFTVAEMAMPCAILISVGIACFAVGTRGLQGSVDVAEPGALRRLQGLTPRDPRALLAILSRMFKRKTEGSVLCTSCGVLVGVNDPTCYNCGRRNPGLWGFGPALRSARQRPRLRQHRHRRHDHHVVLSLVMSRDGIADRARAERRRAADPRRERRVAGVWARLVVDGAHRRLAARRHPPHLLQHDVDPPARSGDRQPVWRRADDDHLHASPASSASR